MPERRRLSPRGRLLGGALAIALCTTVGVAALAIGAVSTIAADIALGGHPIRSNFLTAPQPGAPETIMIIGDDHSGPFVRACNCHLLHADTFMLVRMDPGQSQTSIMSIPRDLLVSFTWKGAQYVNQKFNATYAIGGPPLVLQVARQTLRGITINHVIDVNFSSFIGVVRAIGCVYVDVDHRYLNNQDLSYQPIDLQTGYQRLCAEPALSYVRYRHNDSDFVRVARQQDFIRQAKEQLGIFDLISKFDQIAKAFGHAIHTDIRGTGEINQLLQLVAFSQTRPIRDVPFKFADGNYQIVTPIGVQDYVTSTPQLIAQSVSDFLYAHPQAPLPSAPTHLASGNHRARRHHHHHAARAAGTPGLVPLSATVKPQALALEPGLGFPLYVPSQQTYTAQPNDFHDYTVRDESGHLYYGYRVDWWLGVPGEYYGIEGMTWTNPPLFANPSATVTINGRSYMFIDDGSHFHDIGWRVGNNLYWVSNTLNETLSNAQMLAIAESAQPLKVG